MHVLLDGARIKTLPSRLAAVGAGGAGTPPAVAGVVAEAVDFAVATACGGDVVTGHAGHEQASFGEVAAGLGDGVLAAHAAGSCADFVAGMS